MFQPTYRQIVEAHRSGAIAEFSRLHPATMDEVFARLDLQEYVEAAIKRFDTVLASLFEKHGATRDNGGLSMPMGDEFAEARAALVADREELLNRQVETASDWVPIPVEKLGQGPIPSPAAVAVLINCGIVKARQKAAPTTG